MNDEMTNKSIKLNHGPFWMVWNPNGLAPTYKHQSEQSAIDESERLARSNPGETFVVLESVCARCQVIMAKIDMRPDRPPF